MRKLVYISTFLMLVAVVSSCTKNEVESPQEKVQQETVKAQPLNIDRDNSSMDQLDDDVVIIDQTPMTINDDGDDEDEGINTVTDDK